MDKTTGLNNLDGKGFNCCESTLLNIHREHPLHGFEPNVMRAASLTGAGVGWSGSGCGAVVGIATALGLAYGTDGEESLEEYGEKRARNKALIRPLLREFKETFGSVNCKGLIGLDLLDDEDAKKWPAVFAERNEKGPVKCDDYIDWAAKRVLETLGEG
jgi:C_GCAxxG_C_C family probable redox protein